MFKEEAGQSEAVRLKQGQADFDQVVPRLKLRMDAAEPIARRYGPSLR